MAADGPAIAPKGHGRKPEAVRERAVVALLSQPTLSRAAEASGVSERTLRRWLAEDPTFKQEFDSARAAAYAAGIGRIHALTAHAVATLEQLLDATDHPSVRLGAARTIAEIGMNHYEVEQVERKLSILEAEQRRQSEERTR